MSGKRDNRIDRAFAECRRAGRKALVLFVSAGDPDLETSEQLIEAIGEAGADVVEIGVPFSDPMADGPTIQAASQRALAGGATLPKILDMIRRVRRRVEIPFVLFSYYNVMLNYGLQALARDSAAAGVDGWLVVDVPAEEAEEVSDVMTEHNLHRIPLVAPTTPAERIPLLLRCAAGFVYYIAVKGVTGARAEMAADLESHIGRIRAVTSLPVVAGFGVSGPESARRTARYADGVVVGSRLIDIVSGAETPRQGVEAGRTFVTSLAEALQSPIAAASAQG